MPLGPHPHDALDDLGPGAALGSDDDDLLLVFLFGLEEHLVLLRAIGGRFLEIYVLAGLEGEQGSGGVPVVGHCDHHCVDILALDHLADVGFGIGKIACDLLYGLTAILEGDGVAVADAGDLDLGHLADIGRYGLAAAVDTGDTDADFVVNADNAGFCGFCAGLRQAGE